MRVLTPDALLRILQRYSQGHKVFVAFSGGCDSHVLLHLCSRIPTLSKSITAVYIDHGLQEESTGWAVHCQWVADQLGVKFKSISVTVLPIKGESLEAMAREARYQAIAALLAPGDIVLTAHHQEDQYETILLKMFRGAGLVGLSGISEHSNLGVGQLIRPLLAVTKQAIDDYAMGYQLKFIQDPSNTCIDFDRNYLRNIITPLIKDRWPSVDTTVSRAGRHCHQGHVLISELIDPLFQQVFCQQEQALFVTLLQGLNPLEQPMIIRHWFKWRGLEMPSERAVNLLLTQVLSAGKDRCPELIVGDYCVRRFQDKLYLLKAFLPVDADFVQRWPQGENTLVLKDNGQLRRMGRVQWDDGRDFWQHYEVTVRYRNGGEKIGLPGRSGTHLVKKLFQEAKVPPWLRSRMPFIFFDGQLAAVGDKWVADAFYEMPAGDKLQFKWTLASNNRKENDEKENNY
mgnify:FL=1